MTLLIAEHGESAVLHGHHVPLPRPKKVLMYHIFIHLRRIKDFEPRPPSPPAANAGSDSRYDHDGTRRRGGGSIVHGWAVGPAPHLPEKAEASPVTPTRLVFGPEAEEAADSSWIRPKTKEKVRSPPEQPGPAPALVASPTNSPSTAAAMAATTSFLAGITLATRSPLLSGIPTTVRAAPPPATPTPSLRRSNRLASQPLNLTVRPSKKGEVLAMNRLGFIGKGEPNIEEARKEYIKNLPALRDLLPVARGLSGGHKAGRDAGTGGLSSSSLTLMRLSLSMADNFYTDVWNVRGLNARAWHNVLRDVCREANAASVCVQ